jgi:hypothetical protein
MPVLKNHKHELFAQRVAADEAYVLAGYVSQHTGLRRQGMARPNAAAQSAALGGNRYAPLHIAGVTSRACKSARPKAGNSRAIREIKDRPKGEVVVPSIFKN